MSFLRSVLVLLVSMLACCIGTASANILLNPGFESGSGPDADDWLEVGGPSGSSSRSGTMPNTGSFSAYMQVDHINNEPAATPYAVEQIQPVGSIDNTANYNLSFSAKVDTLDFEGIDMFYHILWLDQDASDGGGVKGETLTSLVLAGINTSYQSFGLSDTDVPDGADSFQLRFQLSPGPIPGIVNGLYVDDVVLESTSSQLPGDFDLDEDVDGADFLLWQRTDGTSPELLKWQTNYGQTSGNLAVVTTIPEPSTFTLLWVGCMFVIRNRGGA